MRRTLFLFMTSLLLSAACTPYRVVVLNDRHGAEKQNNLGVVWLKQGEGELALRKFRKAAILSPEWSIPHVNAGNAHAMEMAWRYAEKEYRSALELEPDNIDANNNLAVALAAQGRFKEARKWAERAVSIEPDPRCLDTLAEILIPLGEHEEAYAILEKALNASPPPALRRALLAKKSLLDLLPASKDSP